MLRLPRIALKVKVVNSLHESMRANGIDLSNIHPDYTFYFGTSGALWVRMALHDVSDVEESAYNALPSYLRIGAMVRSVCAPVSDRNHEEVLHLLRVKMLEAHEMNARRLARIGKAA